MFRVIPLLLIACEPISDKSDSAVETSGHTAETEDPAETGDSGDVAMLYGVTDGALMALLAWERGVGPFRGYSAASSPSGIYLADPMGTRAGASVYRIPWTTEGSVVIEEAADVVLTTGRYGPDKIGYDAVSGMLSIPDADATTDAAEHAGVAYSLPEPEVSGELADLAPYSFAGGHETGYTGRVLWTDADGDGVADDVLVTSTTPDDPLFIGELAVYLDPSEGDWLWEEADLHLDVCNLRDTATLAYGPVDIVESDGYIYVACPSSSYAEGTVEVLQPPFDEGDDAPGAAILGAYLDVSGWFVAADPRGGVWMDARGRAILQYSPGPAARHWYGLYAGDSYEAFGAAPFVFQTAGGQTLLLVGNQQVSSTSGVYLCDVTELPAEDEFTDVADLTCGYYAVPEGLTCTGAIQGATELDGVLYFYSSGWVFGSGDGCGAAVWKVTPYLGVLNTARIERCAPWSHTLCRPTLSSSRRNSGARTKHWSGWRRS